MAKKADAWKDYHDAAKVSCCCCCCCLFYYQFCAQILVVVADVFTVVDFVVALAEQKGKKYEPFLHLPPFPSSICLLPNIFIPSSGDEKLHQTHQ